MNDYGDNPSDSSKDASAPLHHATNATHASEDLNAAETFNASRDLKASEASRPCEPDMHLEEEAQGFLIHIALPGVMPENILLEVTAHTLHLTAERFSFHNPDYNVVLKAAPSASGQRRTTFPSRFEIRRVLPALIQVEGVEARCQHGLLVIRLPKQSPTAPRRVPISVSGFDSSFASGQAATPAPPEATIPDTRQGLHAPADTSPTADTEDSEHKPPEDRWYSQSLKQQNSRSHEGDPAGKLGAGYTPTGGEDHISQARLRGETEPY